MTWCSLKYLYCRYLLVLLTCGFLIPLSAQDNGLSVFQQRLLICQKQYEASQGLDAVVLQDILRKTDDLLQISLPETARRLELHSELFLLRSRVHQSQQDFPAAFRAIDSSMQLVKRLGGRLDLRYLAQMDQYASLLYVYKEQYQEAILWSEQITHLLQPLSPTERAVHYQGIVVNNFIRMADLKDRTGDIVEAKKLIQECATFLGTQPIEAKNRYRFQLFQLHYLYYHSSLTEAQQKAKTLLSQLESSTDKNKVQLHQLAATQAIYGNIFYSLGKLSLAENYYQSALSNYERLSPFFLFEQQEIQHDLANCYQAQGKYAEGRALLDREIEQTNSNALNYDLRLADLYSSLAANFYAEYSHSQENLDLLLEAVHYDETSRNHYYQHRSQLWNVSDVQMAAGVENLSQGRSLAILYEAYQQTGKSVYFFQALEVLEQNKNIQLRAQLKRWEEQQQPAALQQELKQLDTLHNIITELSYSQEYQPLLSSKQKDSLFNKLISSKQLLKEKQTQLINSFPVYQQQLWDKVVVNQKALTRKLAQQQQTLVCITSAENEFYLLAFSSKGYIFQKAPLNAIDLENRVEQFRQQISHSPSQPSQQQLLQLASLSQEFYQLFLQPIEDIATSRLLLLVDPPLATLSFSLFLEEEVDIDQPFTSWPFAVHRYSFNYTYALDFYLHPPGNSNTASQQAILAFAPTFEAGYLRGDTTRSKGTLRKNAEEVTHLSWHFPCEAYVGEEARLALFRELAPDFAVLHLATHAVADLKNGDNSFLTFSETSALEYRLRASELYQMQLPASLVVLSACETSIGEWQAGEGIVGLERAFTAAGAQSLLSTHWKVSDQASAQLMQLFYGQLAGGLPKDVALQQAQIQFITTYDSWLAHPFFWAGFVQKGATDPLVLSAPAFSRSWLYGLLLVLAGVVYLYLRDKATFK